MNEGESEYYLKYAGREDSKMLREAVKHLDVFPLWRDSEARVINFDEYKVLVEQKSISPHIDFWCVKKGQVGIIVLRRYLQYINTWEKIDSAFQDFQDGWRACEKHLREEVTTIKIMERRPITTAKDGKTVSVLRIYLEGHDIIAVSVGGYGFGDIPDKVDKVEDGEAIKI